MKKYCVNLLRKTLLKKVFSNSLLKNFNLKSTTGLHSPVVDFILKVFGKGSGGEPFFRKVSPSRFT